jgi:DNA-binding NarL/FixJ family response regulator
MQRPGSTGEFGTTWHVVLRGSDHPGWTALRATLREHPGTCIVGEADDPEEMLAMALHYQAEMVLLAAERVTRETIPVLRDLHAHHQVCKMVVVGELADPEQLVDLARAGVVAHLRWADIRLEHISRILSVLNQHDVLMLSRTAVRQLLAHVGGEVGELPGAVELTVRERAILRRLADGLELQAIAKGEGLSLRVPRMHPVA